MSQSESTQSASQSTTVSVDGSESDLTHPYNMSYDLYTCPDAMLAGDGPFGARPLFVAKIEDHPNSTTYEDVLVPTINITRMLEHTIEHSDIVGPFATKLAHYIKEYGSSFVFGLTYNASAGDIAPGQIYVMTTNSQIVRRVLSLAHTTLAPPFDNLYGTYAAQVESDMRFFGVSVGLLITVGSSSYRGSWVGFADYTVAGCHKDVRNCDGDLVCNPPSAAYAAGSYFQTLPSAPAFVAVRLDQFVTEPRVIDVATAVLNTSDAAPYTEFAVYDMTGAPIDSGSDPLDELRIGDGVDDTGISGALPSVYAGYGLFMSGDAKTVLRSPTGRRLQSGSNADLPGMGRAKFTIFGCTTSCQNNATHQLLNSPLYDAHDAVPTMRNFTFLDRFVTVDGAPQINSTVYARTNPAVFFSAPGRPVGGLSLAMGNLDGLGEGVATVQFDPVRTAAFTSTLAQDFSAVIYDANNISASNAGVFMNLREAPYDMTLFGFGVGAVFVGYTGVRNVTQCTACFIPSGVAFVFWDSRDQYLKHGDRIRGLSTLRVRRKFRIALNTDLMFGSYTDYAEDEVVEFVTDIVPGNPESNVNLTQGYRTTPRTAVTASASAISDTFFVDEAAISMTSDVASCWQVFSDSNLVCTSVQATPVATYMVLSGMLSVVIISGVIARMFSR
jgi:hypothetical protein